MRLQGSERRQRLSQSVSQGRCAEGRPGHGPAENVALEGHSDGGAPEIGDLQPEGQPAQYRRVRLAHLGVEPGVPRVVENAFARDLGGDREAGIEPRLERTLAQERRRESVDRGDRRSLDVGGRRSQASGLRLVLRLFDGFLYRLA